MCLFRPRISLIVPLIDWVKTLACAALDAIAECVADAGRFASDTFFPSGEVKQSRVSLSTTKELGSRHAAILCSALMGVADSLYLLKSRALGLFNYVSSWKRAIKSSCLWFLRRATSIAASPLVILQAAFRFVTSWRGSFDMQAALWERLSQSLWKNPRFGSLVARLHVNARSVRRAFFVTAVILSWVFSDLTLFNDHCHGASCYRASRYSSSLLASSPLLLCQETFDEDALTDEDNFIVTDEICELAKSAAADEGCQWASGFSVSILITPVTAFLSPFSPFSGQMTLRRSWKSKARYEIHNIPWTRGGS